MASLVLTLALILGANDRDHLHQCPIDGTVWGGPNHNHICPTCGIELPKMGPWWNRYYPIYTPPKIKNVKPLKTWDF